MSLQTTKVLEGFDPSDLIAWMSNIKLVTSREMDQIFVKELGDIVTRKWFSSLIFFDNNESDHNESSMTDSMQSSRGNSPPFTTLGLPRLKSDGFIHGQVRSTISFDDVVDFSFAII